MITDRERHCPISFISAGEEAWTEDILRARGLDVEDFSDPWLFRQALLEGPAGLRRAVVGDTSPIEAVNVAAAVVRDGRARSVYLVSEHPSGSLRSRAAQAKITRVLEPWEVVEALGLDLPSVHDRFDERAMRARPHDPISHPLEDEGERGPSDDFPLDVDEVAHRHLFLRSLPTIEEAEVVEALSPWGDDLEEPELGRVEGARGSSTSSKRTAGATRSHQAPGLGNGEEALRKLRHKPFSSRVQEARESRHDSMADTTLLPTVGSGHSHAHLTLVDRVDEASASPRLVLVSGRGGVGKSAIAALMAATAASWGMEVALVDLDLAFGNLFGYFGLEGPADLTPLASADLDVELERMGRQVAERLTLFGPCAKPEFAETVAPRTAEILERLSATFDLVVVDGGTSWGDAVAQATQMSSRLLVCSDERAGAIGTLSRVGLLAQRLGVARTRICRLINRCDPRHRDEGFISRADAGFETARQLSIFEGGIEVGELMSAGHACELVDLPNDFSESVAHHLALILSELGILPDDERARKAAGEKGHGKRAEVFPFFRALAS